MTTRIACLIFMTAWLGSVGCDEDDPDLPMADADADADADGDGDADGDADVPPGYGVGEACERDRECRTGLGCDEDSATCQPVPDGALGEPCALSGECGAGLYCGPTGTCEPAGEQADGEPCGSPADCGPGLYCDVRGLSGGACAAAGSADWGASCESTSDCLPGLFCGSALECAPFLLAFPPWLGAECPPDEEASVAYFEVPRGGEAPNDFFRLPYPNDVRLVDGHPDLSGFPTPGPGLIGVDLVQLYREAIERDMTGFGTNGPVTFRFSQGIDYDTVSGSGEGATFEIADITPASPGYGANRGWHWTANHSTRYICPNWLAIGPTEGQPFAPATTYAIWVTTGVRDGDGGAIARDEDFEAMMSDEAPADPDLSAAHGKYQLLRDYLDAQGIARDTVLVASVFTTAPVREPASRLREAIAASGDPPAPLDTILCDEGVVSICVDGGDPIARDCEAADDRYHEIHGRFENPMMQEGNRPYEVVGGAIVTDEGGMPIVQGTEEVCFSLSIPKGTAMPAAGWPIIVSSHGTGGNFRSAMRDEIAGGLASVQTDGGQTVSFAVLGYDGAMHGDRRGGSTRGEDELFFNALNPPAARDNVLQGAADLFQIVRLVRGFTLDAASSPTGEEIRFDASRIYFFGHSQGSTVGALFVPYEEDVDVAVFSGAGAVLVESLLHKTSPVDATLGMALVLQESLEDLREVGPDHPVLHLFQAYFDPADAVNYNRLLAREAIDGGNHFLQTYGLGDTFSPVETLRSFARSSSAATLNPVLDETGSGSDPVDAPASLNLQRPGFDFTAVVSQHDPGDGFDGHFVAFEDATANRRVLQFLATAAATGIPTVVP